MTAKKTNLLLIAAIVILCLAMVVGAHVTSGLLSGKSKNLVSLQLKLSSQQSEISQLGSAQAQIKKYQPLAAIAKDIVPQDKNQAETVRQIVNIAAANSISLESISFPSSDLGVSTPKKAADSKVNLSQLSAVKGMPGLYSLPITIASDVQSPIHFSQVIGFLEGMEQNRRTAQVTNLVLTPDAKQPSLMSFSITINEYIKP